MVRKKFAPLFMHDPIDIIMTSDGEWDRPPVRNSTRRRSFE